jgi:hypothetical protein
VHWYLVVTSQGTGDGLCRRIKIRVNLTVGVKVRVRVANQIKCDEVAAGDVARVDQRRA